MSKTVTIEKIDQSLIQALDPEGELNLLLCLQCGRCSSGCTMRQETDVLPHQLNRMAALGMKKQLLESKAIWACISCNTCVSRCPMKVDTPALVDALRSMAQSAPGDLERVKIFNETMLASVKRFGRSYELGLMAIYKLKAKDFFSDLAKFPTMLLKGKMRLSPPSTKGRGAVAAIFDRVRQARRAQR
jgi:heterodisulfide reductase subunit C